MERKKSFHFLFIKNKLLLDEAFFDTSFLTGEFTEVVKLSAANFTEFVNDDRVDKRRFDREDTFNTNVVAHFANGETLFVTFTSDFDNDTTVLLDTFLVTFLDTVRNSDSITCTEIRVLFAGSKCFFSDFN